MKLEGKHELINEVEAASPPPLLPMESFHRGVAGLTAAMLDHAKSLRGVPAAELEGRLGRAQGLMEAAGLDSLLLTTEHDFYYFTGLPSRFWLSPTRPFFLLVPREGPSPIAVVPSIMQHCIVSRTWIGPDCVRTWAAPQPDDDGVTLLARTIAAGLPQKYCRVGFQMGPESVVRAPLSDIDRVRALLQEEHGVAVADGSGIMRALRLIKSPLEVSRVRHACAIASAAFALFPTRLHCLRATKQATAGGAGEISEREARNVLRVTMLELGADDTPYVMAQSGKGGYDNIVLEPSDTPLEPGTILVIDTGATFEGYWCDFDRNFIVGGAAYIPPKTAACHDMLWRATDLGFAEAARKGATSSSVFRAMARECGIPDHAADDAGVGRFGHGLGLQLTELFSNNASDHTPLEPGVVMTLEPSALVDPSQGDEMMLAHEEDIVITEHGPEWLSLRAPRHIPAILPHLAAAPGAVGGEEAIDPLVALPALCGRLIRELGLG